MEQLLWNSELNGDLRGHVVLNDAGVLVHPEENSPTEHLGHSPETPKKVQFGNKNHSESKTDHLVLRRETEWVGIIKS